MDNPIKSEKPIDRWLGIGGIAVAIVLFLIPKTPPVVVSSLVLMFGLLIHPICHFWWIEDKPWRRWAATALLVVALWYLGKAAWPLESSASQPHFINTFRHWLYGPHGRWFDKVIGAVYALAFIFVLLFLAALAHAVRKQKPKVGKGFLDYKLQAEIAIMAMPPILVRLNVLADEVNQSVDSLTAAFNRSAGSTAKALDASKASASSLDRYSSQMRRVHAQFGREGRLFAEGLRGWFAWIQKMQPPKSDMVPFADMLRGVKQSLDGAIEHLGGAIIAMSNAKGAFSVLDAALDRQIEVRKMILETCTEISQGCATALTVCDALPTRQ
jgi:uncharacterized protein YoxC